MNTRAFYTHMSIFINFETTHSTRIVVEVVMAKTCLDDVFSNEHSNANISVYLRGVKVLFKVHLISLYIQYTTIFGRQSTVDRQHKTFIVLELECKDVSSLSLS